MCKTSKVVQISLPGKRVLSLQKDPKKSQEAMTGYSAEEAELRVMYFSSEDTVERVSDCLLELRCVLDL